jgi:predicted enzyme related to lactoylglutathione lyase
MPIVNALAGIMVSDLTTAAAWYEQLLSRPADARPMEGLAEWKLADGGWIQVFQDTKRAGSSSVTFLVSGLDDQLAELKAKGISIERTTTSDYVKTATVTDPAGNRVVFAELCRAALVHPATATARPCEVNRGARHSGESC